MSTLAALALFASLVAQIPATPAEVVPVPPVVVEDAPLLVKRLIDAAELPFAAQAVRASGMPEAQVQEFIKTAQKLDISASQTAMILKLLAQDFTRNGPLPDAERFILEPFLKASTDMGAQGSTRERFDLITEETLRHLLDEARRAASEKSSIDAKNSNSPREFQRVSRSVSHVSAGISRCWSWPLFITFRPMFSRRSPSRTPRITRSVPPWETTRVGRST